MNRKQILFGFSILLVVGLAAWGLVLGGERWLPKQAEEPHILSGTRTSAGDYIHTEKTDFYTIEVTFPAKTPLAEYSLTADKHARDTMEKALLSATTDFKTNIGTFDTTMQEFIASRGVPLAQDITYTAYISPKFVSYKYLVYEDTGGAHPNGYFRTFVFDHAGTQVQFHDLFVTDSQYLERISLEVIKQVKAKITAEAGADAADSIFADGVAPQETNFQNFAIDGDALRIFIPPYQVAAYAAGDFEIVIPLSSLAGTLRK